MQIYLKVSCKIKCLCCFALDFESRKWGECVMPAVFRKVFRKVSAIFGIWIHPVLWRMGRGSCPLSHSLWTLGTRLRFCPHCPYSGWGCCCLGKTKVLRTWRIVTLLPCFQSGAWGHGTHWALTALFCHSHPYLVLDPAQSSQIPESINLLFNLVSMEYLCSVGP